MPIDRDATKPAGAPPHARTGAVGSPARPISVSVTAEPPASAGDPLRANLALMAPGHRPARRPGAHPARPHRRADRARLRQGGRGPLHRRLPAGRGVLRHPAARAVQDGRRGRALQRRHPDRPGRRAPDARPVHPDRGVRHPAPHRRAGGQADRLPGHLGQPVDADHRPLRQRPAARARRLGGDPVPGQPGAGHPGALQAPAGRGLRHALRAGDRGPGHRPGRGRRGAAAGDGPPDRRRDRRLRGRARHRRPPARPAARRADGRRGRRPDPGHPRLPARRPQVAHAWTRPWSSWTCSAPPS